MPRNPAKTRKRILSAAYVLLYRSGFTRTGVEDIATAANVTKRTLYGHFPCKHALLAESLRSQAETVLAALFVRCNEIGEGIADKGNGNRSRRVGQFALTKIDRTSFRRRRRCHWLVNRAAITCDPKRR